MVTPMLGNDFDNISDDDEFERARLASLAYDNPEHATQDDPELVDDELEQAKRASLGYVSPEHATQDDPELVDDELEQAQLASLEYISPEHATHAPEHFSSIDGSSISDVDALQKIINFLLLLKLHVDVKKIKSN